MLFEASRHSLTPAGIENMYHPLLMRSTGLEQISTPGGPPTAVDQLIYAAFECAVSILREAGSPVRFVIELNAYQLDLFLFKDVGIGGILSKFISRMNDPEIGKYEGYFLPEPVATWYGSFCTYHMTYLDIAGQDSVLAAQVASPGTPVTIQFIALALGQAEEQARANEQDLNEYLENRTIADIVEQFTQEENCAWLMNHDFFTGNNGSFATVREVSEASHDIMMGDTISSDVSMGDADSPREESGPGQAATLDETAATAQSGGSMETAGLSSSSASAPRTVLGVEEPPGLLAIEDIKPDEHYRASDQTAQVRGLISQSVLSSLGRNILIPTLTPRLFSQAFCHTLMTTSWVTMTHMWRTSTGLWMTTGTQSPSHLSSLRVMCRGFCFLQREREVINRVRTQAAGSVEQVTGRDTRGVRAFAQTEIKRHWQGLRRVKLIRRLGCHCLQPWQSSSPVYSETGRAKDAAPHHEQTSHIMMLVEGTSLSVNQWDQKLRSANWTLSSSDDHHHWVGVRTASSGTSITKLVDNCGSDHQKIWYAIFDVKLGCTSNGEPVWKGGQNAWWYISTMQLSEQLAVPAESTLQTCWSCVPTSRLT